jgi:hypothetical protein
MTDISNFPSEFFDSFSNETTIEDQINQHLKLITDSVEFRERLHEFRSNLPTIIPSPDSINGIKLRCDFLEVTKLYLKSQLKLQAEVRDSWIKLVDLYIQILQGVADRSHFLKLFNNRKTEAQDLALFLRTDKFFNRDFLIFLVGKTQEERDILCLKTIANLIMLIDICSSTK